jgi:hypothetical protein
MSPAGKQCEFPATLVKKMVETAAGVVVEVVVTDTVVVVVLM